MTSRDRSASEEHGSGALLFAYCCPILQYLLEVSSQKLTEKMGFS